MASLNHCRTRAYNSVLNLSKHFLRRHQRHGVTVPVARSSYCSPNSHPSESDRMRQFQSNRTKLLTYQHYRLCDPSACVRRYATQTTRYTLQNATYRDFLNSLELECRELSSAQMAGERLGQHKNKRLVVLKQVTEYFVELKSKYSELEELNYMQNEEAMKALVAEEKTECMADIEGLEDKLLDLICPVEKVDDCDILLEIESGAGGQEAMLFVQEMLEMYKCYGQHRGWQFEVTDIVGAEYGIRKVSATVSGQGVYGEMKYEGGVHRVQRIPKTESKGRIHTSTISVAILPQPSEIDITLNPRDLEITSFKSSGPGGQNVQKVNSAVRIKHKPTGHVAECQVSRSNGRNQALALVMLKSRIYEEERQKTLATTTSQRKIQVGNKDRSEKIRTYNFQQDRITDHRLGNNFYNIDDFMSGGDSLQKMITKLIEEANLESLNILLEQFEYDQLKIRDRSK